MRNFVTAVTAVAVGLLPMSGCDNIKEKPPAPYKVVLKVESDPGQPLEGADVLLGANKVAKTKADGEVELKLRGVEGETLTFSIRCPQGYQSPKPINVSLRRIADPKKLPEYRVTCPPTTRTVVVAVRADNGPGLPVMFLGREVARTDASGAAHISLRLRPDEAFQLMLKTSENGKGLRPQNPVATFRVKHQDEIVSLDQGFTVKRRPIRRGPPKGPSPF